MQEIGGYSDVRKITQHDAAERTGNTVVTNVSSVWGLFQRRCVDRAWYLDRTGLGFLYCAMFCSVTSSTRAVLAVPLLLALAGMGCSSKDIQYPEDHARVVRVDAAVEALRNAYVKKDLSALDSLLLPADAMDQLQRDVQSDFANYSEIMLEFAVERIYIDGDNVDVFVHWHGLWKKSETDPGLRYRGHARLEWVGVQSILLRAVQGDLPFGMRTRQAVIQPTNQR